VDAGDMYVPAGQVSFRVNTAARACKWMYSEVLGADSALPGEGCCWVDSGSRSGGGATWLPGNLMLLGERPAPLLKGLAGGAHLGFVWTGAHYRQFLILLTRVDFAALGG
jgi:hypothetical protein